MFESFLLKLISFYFLLLLLISLFSIFAFFKFWLLCMTFFLFIIFIFINERWKFCLSGVSICFRWTCFIIFVWNPIINITPGLLVVIWILTGATWWLSTDIKYLFQPICNLVYGSIIIWILTWIASFHVFIIITYNCLLFSFCNLSSCFFGFFYNSFIVLILFCLTSTRRIELILLLIILNFKIDFFLGLLLINNILSNQ